VNIFLNLGLALVVSVLIIFVCVQSKRLSIKARDGVVKWHRDRQTRLAIERREDVMRYREEREL
jgi:hypothetical protein